MGEDVFYFFVNFNAVFAASFFNNFDAAERLDGALEQLVGLQTYNQFVFTVNVAGFM
ncbi:unknown [Prevotella sp. CAG:617]|nr:unknown [Prevotella sp. CAG:617]